MIIQFVGHILNKKRSKMITKKTYKRGGRITTLYKFTLEDSTEDYSNRKKIQW